MCLSIGVVRYKNQHGDLVLSDVCNMWNTGLVKIMIYWKKMDGKLFFKAFHMKSLGHMFVIIALDCAVDVLVKLPQLQML